jgi:hypothetical protein
MAQAKPRPQVFESGKRSGVVRRYPPLREVIISHENIWDRHGGGRPLARPPERFHFEIALNGQGGKLQPIFGHAGAGQRGIPA